MIDSDALDEVSLKVKKASDVIEVKRHLANTLDLARTLVTQKEDKLLSFLLDSVLVDWGPCFLKADWETSFDVFFGLLSPVSVFFALTKTLQVKTKEVHKSVQSYKWSQTLRLLSTFLGERFFDLLFAILDNHAQARSSWSQVLQTLVSVPERAANRLKDKLDKKFHPPTYFLLLSNNLLDFAEFIDQDPRADALWRTILDDVPIFSQAFDKMSFIGHADAITLRFVAFVTGHAESQKWLDRLERILNKMSKGAESFLESYLYMQSDIFGSLNTNILILLFQNLVITNKAYTTLFTTKLMREKVLPQQIQEGVIDFLFAVQKIQFDKGAKEDDGLGLQAFSNLVDMWASDTFIKQATVIQHAYVSNGLYYIFSKGHITKEHLDGSQNELNILPKLIGGVHNHLEYPLKERRYVGMKIAEQFSAILNPENPLNFEYDEPETKKSEKTGHITATTTTTLASITVSERQGQISNKKDQHLTPQSLVEQHYNPTPSQTAAARGNVRKLVIPSSSSSSSECDPDKPFFSGKGRNRSDSYSDGESESESSSDSLESLNLEDDTSDLKKIKIPVYIRECLLGLRSEEPEEILATLNVVTGLIKKEPGDLDEVSVTLAEILLFLGDDYGLEGFEEKRNKALVALATYSTACVVPYLVDQCFTKNMSLKNRIDAINILIKAAQELSWFGFEEEAAQRKPLIQEVPKVLLTKQAAKQERVESHTRRWASRLKIPQATPITKENRFAEFSDLFFSVLNHINLSDSTQRVSFAVLGEDGHMLGRVIYALGVFLESAGVSKDLTRPTREILDFLFMVRYHNQAFVRRSVLFTVNSIFTALPPHLLISPTFADDIEEIFNWLQGVREMDTDSDCVMLASTALSALAELYKTAEREESSSADFMAPLTPLLTHVETRYL